MEFESLIIELLHDLNTDISLKECFFNKTKQLEKLRQQKDMREYNCLIDAILIIFEYNDRGIGIIPELKSILSSIQHVPMYRHLTYKKFYNKYVDKDEIKYPDIIDIDPNMELVINMIDNIIALLKNDKILESGITLLISNMLECLKELTIDINLYKSINELFVENGWTQSGFRSVPSRKLLLDGMQEILELIKVGNYQAIYC